MGRKGVMLIMLGEISQRKTNAVRSPSYMESEKRGVNPKITENRLVDARGRVGGRGGRRGVKGPLPGIKQLSPGMSGMAW